MTTHEQCVKCNFVAPLKEKNHIHKENSLEKTLKIRKTDEPKLMKYFITGKKCENVYSGEHSMISTDQINFNHFLVTIALYLVSKLGEAYIKFEEHFNLKNPNKNSILMKKIENKQI